MLRPSILLSLAFSALAVAQTPEGFTPAVQTQLGVVYPGNITVTPSGVLLQAADTQVAPSLIAPEGTPADGTYIAVMIDLDVMSNGTTTTILHWLQSDFILSPERVLTPGPTNSSLGPPYFGPAPPPGNPHRYTFLLFSQPEDFTIPESFSNLNPPTGITDLFGFNITSFVAATGLDDPLAGNYFRVVNTTGTPTGTPSGTASGTGTPAQTSPAQFEGGSTALKVFSGRDVGLSILFVAVAAGFWAL